MGNKMPQAAAEFQTDEFQAGDLIFQTSSSKQSYAVMWASQSIYSHVGIIEIDHGKKYVIEAIAKVTRTPLEDWIRRGRFHRYAVFRYKWISKDQQASIVRKAKHFLGVAYDIYFTSKNTELYCSELVDSAYRRAGTPIGKFVKVQELDVDNVVVKKLVEQRWKEHPLCRKKTKSFQDCWEKILADPLITPASLAEDSHMEKIFSNYPLASKKL
jgi:hypothetical protein